MKKQKVAPLIFDTYLAVIKNSIGSKLFRNFYAIVDGRKTDIMQNGELSCAFYVSSIYKRGFPVEYDWVLAKRKVELILWSRRLKRL